MDNVVVPTKIFLHYLSRLREVLNRVRAVDKAIGAQRLYPDMFPLLQQAKTAIGFTLRTVCPLAGRDIVSFSDDVDSFESVLAELDSTCAYLEAIPDDAFGRIGAQSVSTAAGFADLNMDGWEYYQMYAMPNFFFHYAMVYAIARHAGVPIGKADFDGYHRYPLGFVYTDECDPADLDNLQ
ncbi:hypothetical protein FHW83_004901 [Duganella sp. SG902]|uniref:DUF1993 domain-containing protein n=1 Tax=Duganella sp. SG902 TaxID=2587016 RepID=UPI00159DCBB0|nr:hypothetical protein [Duganella sp. SG902]